MLGLIQSIGLQPVEVIQEWGLKKVSIIKIAEAGGYSDGDTFYADPSQIGFKGFTHELYHGKDALDCGKEGMSRDEGFNALNPTDTIYTDRGEYISQEVYMEFLLEKQKELEGARKIGDEARIATIKEQIAREAAKVAVFSEYGFKNIVEDKAEFGKEILGMDRYPEMLDPKTPRIRQKFLFLLARVFHDNPKIVQYLADITSRPDAT
jgi:hypothetical protein